MKIKNLVLGFVVGLVVAGLVFIYSLKITRIENTETGALISIEIFGTYFNYYYEY